MDLLEFARGPLWYGAVFVFVSGIAWRLAGLWRLGSSPLLSAPRSDATGFSTVFTRMLPRAGFHPSATLATVNPYVYHLGLAVVVFGYAPHIAFVQRLTGAHWPALPDGVIYVTAGATIVSLLIALMFRLNNPVLRLISGAGDYFAWGVTMLPLLTGMVLITGEPGGSGPLRLAMHLMSLELLLAWFPFGKLMHAFLFAFSRGATGIRFGHRGVDT